MTHPPSGFGDALRKPRPKAHPSDGTPRGPLSAEMSARAPIDVHDQAWIGEARRRLDVCLARITRLAALMRTGDAAPMLAALADVEAERLERRMGSLARALRRWNARHRGEGAAAA